jgi:hypothetical protein
MQGVFVQGELAVNISLKLYPLILGDSHRFTFHIVCHKMDINCNLILPTLSNNTWICTRILK